MKILLNDSVGKSEHYSCLESLDSALGDFSLDCPVDAKLLVRQQSDNVYKLSGNLQVSITSSCDRCCKEIPIHVDREFCYVLRIGQEPENTSEYQCSEEDFETLYLTEAAIDSNALIVEQLLLAIPLQRLCEESCKGLCKECGINLNIMKCQCGEINPNSPFAILKTLK